MRLAQKMKKKKIKSAAMLTFQELLLFSDKVFKKKNPTYMTREVANKLILKKLLFNVTDR